jgi:glycosyltransferase involved in cell wall biosynthesis
VVARSPGLVDSSKDGVNGLFYDYGDIGQLAQKLDLLMKDDELRLKLGRQAVGWAKQWTWDRAADATEKVIERAVEEYAKQEH